MSAWGSFWRSVRRDSVEPSTPSSEPDVLELLARDHMYVLAERDKAIRQRDAFAFEVAKLRLDRNFARSLVHASPVEAKRACLEMSDRNAELRSENEALERQVAELQGRRTQPDWTGNPTVATRPS